MKLHETHKNNRKDLLSESPFNISTKTNDMDYTILKYSQTDSDFSNEIVKECVEELF